ncbi:MAG: hypothetical protein GWN79_29635, partial [Actinobacteria bacterium]|nr:hypothetical protein [Actinomycetota bacterium]NIS37561.1 hypothetical protein [Actinomycetota bacterium]NIT99354.1 hypothetical protein [Actinomycetota bacterium]NIU22946.1 hypothetical protein [Actinomycetota bacterium]NIU71982.1 hypothetical protein [Actinomycetota bacterium]
MGGDDRDLHRLPPPLRDPRERHAGRPDRVSEPMSVKTIATNRRARFDYEILDTFEAGIVLLGSEVKSLRDGQADLKDAYAHVHRGEMWLVGV